MNPTPLRGLLATGLGLGLACTALPADAAAPAPVPLVGASFAVHAGHPTHDLAWRVAGPTVTRAMVGSRVALAAAPAAGIDCASLAVGMTTTAWVPLAHRETSCSAKRAATTVVIGKQMVGHRVELRGWAAAGASTRVRMAGTVVAQGRQGSATTTVTRPARKQPAPALTGARTLGTIDGVTVQIGTSGTQQVVLVGRTVHPTLQGTTWHAGVDGRGVDVWTKGSGGLRHWHLDVPSGRESTTTVPGTEVVAEGVPGFWVRVPAADSPTGMPQVQLLSWAGVQRDATPDGPMVSFRKVGFTDLAAVLLTGMAPTGVTLVPLDGRAAYSVTTPLPMYRSTVDATGVVVTYGDEQICRVEYGSTTCPGN